MTACHRLLTATALLVLPGSLLAQRPQGRPIGKVTTIGNLIHLELDERAITTQRLFDLDHRTLRFTPDGSGYRVENVALQWDADFGPALTGGTATLEHFTFPFSGKSWDAINVATGSVTFGALPAGAGGRGGVPAGNRTGAGGSARTGFQMERYPTLQTVGRTFINMVPGIAAFVKPRLSGERYVKELADRVVVTWSLTEEAGGIQAFTWVPTVNRIQAVLHRNGVIELSYNDVSARDAVVGVFPAVTAGVAKTIATLADADDIAVAPNLDVKGVTLSAIDGLFLKATIETRGAVLPAGDPAINGLTYRIGFNQEGVPTSDLARATVVWTIRGAAGGRSGGGGGRGGAPRYLASGPGAEADVTVSGNTISIKGILPLELSGATRVSVSADASSGTPPTAADQVASRTVSLSDIRSPELDLSSATRSAGPFVVAYEGFHWPEIPRAQDVACSVITALGDRFDFLASYSDFRVDNPEGGTPSTGPRGGNVSGIGSSTNSLEAYCSKGQLQFMFAQPVSTSAVQIQEKSPDGRMSDYNYAVSQIGHELGHRWAASASALVNGETIPLGPTHWGAGVHLQAAFPYGRTEESDLMGGSTWKENGDGTYTQLDRDYYNPAKGWSWLALYLMGLARPEEVPPFFILRNLQRTGQQDANGKPIFRGDKTAITINDVIAAMGPRVPDFDNAQKTFNTGIVVITMNGRKPTPELLKSATDIRERWIAFWSKTTGGRSVMTATPQ
jgi:hypothetical protein